MEPPKLVTFQTIAYLFEENRVLKAPPLGGRRLRYTDTERHRI
jgi:hypothetical protein